MFPVAPSPGFRRHPLRSSQLAVLSPLRVDFDRLRSPDRFPVEPIQEAATRQAFDRYLELRWSSRRSLLDFRSREVVVGISHFRGLPGRDFLESGA